jgi:hypothetical protein
LADGIATPPTNKPAAANNATVLADFNSPPISRFPKDRFDESALFLRRLPPRLQRTGKTHFFLPHQMYRNHQYGYHLCKLNQSFSRNNGTLIMYRCSFNHRAHAGYIGQNKSTHEYRVWEQKKRSPRSAEAVARARAAPSPAPRDTCATPSLRG